MSASWERVFKGTVNTTDTLLYTVPAGHKLVIRTVSLYEAANTTTTKAILGIGSASGTDRFLVRNPLSQSITELFNDLRIVLYAGETLHGIGGTNSFGATVCGYLIEV